MQSQAADAAMFPESSLYIWDAEVAVKLRRDHRIVGALLGASFGFEQGNDNPELPLQLSPYEAGVAMELGVLGPAAAAPEAAPQQDCAATAAAPGAAGGAAPAEAAADTPATESAESNWKEAVAAKGRTFTLPMRSRQPGTAIHSSTAQGEVLSDEQRRRQRRLHIVFRDLHARGFHVTGGHKFGGDFLCYQGDPHLFHAQYCVRVQHTMEVRSHVLLAAARRGAMGAKKHFLLAQVVFPQDDAAAAAGEINPASDVPYVFYHNLEQDGTLGPTQDVVLTAGDYNSKLVRNFA